MCLNDPCIEIDLSTVVREFHEIKHILADLYESVGKIASALTRCENQQTIANHKIPISGPSRLIL
jgi:hypothetical protein